MTTRWVLTIFFRRMPLAPVVRPGLFRWLFITLEREWFSL